VKSRIIRMLGPVLSIVTLLVTIPAARAAEAATTVVVPVKMTVTASVAEDKRMPEITQQDVFVKKGKERLTVTGWVPAQGDQAGLELFILIDDASNTSLGSHLDELRTFINAQPPSTSVGVGYMSNATVQILQNFTTDHAQAAKVVRLPLGYAGAFGSPYLSVIDLMKRWPASPNRHEVIMITDGIDRARRGSPGFRGLSTNPDADSAGDVAQRTGTIVHSIYAPGVGRLHRNYWEANNGQMNISRLSDVTGGESFYLGLQSAVSFAPYLDDLQKILNNQYILTFSAKPEKKAGLQYVKVSTELAGVELSAPDAAWVPAAPK
jgi:hypothetical protein